MRKSNFGRSAGWEMYFAQRKIAELLDPVYYEMFWESYRLDHVAPLFEEQVKTNQFWEHASIRFKSKALDEFLDWPYVIISINDKIVENRVSARGLYFCEYVFLDLF